MAKLILMKTGAAEEHALTKGITHLGRTSENDICVEEPSVSSRHARIGYDEANSQYWLEDLASTNGTLVNGKKIKRQHLSSGDVVQLGRVKMTFSEQETEASRTVVIAPGATAKGKLMIALKALNGPRAGEVTVLDKECIVLGRKGECQAEISRSGSDAYIAYLGGAHLPRINGKRTGVERERLEDKDVIDVGGIEMEVLIR